MSLCFLKIDSHLVISNLMNNIQPKFTIRAHNSFHILVDFYVNNPHGSQYLIHRGKLFKSVWPQKQVRQKKTRNYKRKGKFKERSVVTDTHSLQD